MNGDDGPVTPRRVETVDGVAVTISGDGAKPLLLPTRMASAGFGIWDAIWDDLAQHYTVATFDLLGAARLDAEMAPRDRFLTLAGAQARIAERLGFPRYSLFGWYGGCHVALAGLIAERERVDSCLLLDPFFELPDMRKVEAGIAFKQALFEHPDRTLYARYWVMAGFSPAFMERRFDVVERLARTRVEKDRFVALDTARWRRWVRALRTNWASDAELAAIDVPVRVLATELDGWHAGPTVGMAQALCARLRTADLATLPGVGTFFFIEDPARFRAAAGPFLARHGG